MGIKWHSSRLLYTAIACPSWEPLRNGSPRLLHQTASFLSRRRWDINRLNGPSILARFMVISHVCTYMGSRCLRNSSLAMAWDLLRICLLETVCDLSESKCCHMISWMHPLVNYTRAHTISWTRALELYWILAAAVCIYYMYTLYCAYICPVHVLNRIQWYIIALNHRKHEALTTVLLLACIS